jgi:hypothetical protein
MIIAHRRNTLRELMDSDPKYGVEVDIRSHGGDLVIHHDPFVVGESFEEWIKNYRHGSLVLNVKEEGLEQALLNILHSRGINDFFFLDQSFPFLVKWARKGEKRCAVRVSEYESMDTALSLAGLVDWVWVDCFTRFPLDQSDVKKLRSAGFRLCLVSPELQGRTAEDSIPALRQQLLRLGINADAVCTKRPDLWEATL